MRGSKSRAVRYSHVWSCSREFNRSRRRARLVFGRPRLDGLLSLGARALCSRRDAGLRLRPAPSRRARGARARAQAYGGAHADMGRQTRPGFAALAAISDTALTREVAI